MRWAILAAAGALAGLAMAAEAGTPEDPEIVDPAGDSSSPVAEADVVGAWIDDAIVVSPAETADPSVKLHVLLAGDFEFAPGFFAGHLRFRVTMLPATGVPNGGAEVYLHVVPTRGSTSAVVTTVPNGPEGVSCRYGVAPAAGGSQDLTEEIVLAGELVSPTDLACYVPLALLNGAQEGSIMTSLKVEEQLVQRGPLSGGDNAGVNVLATFDTAPDSGFGRDYRVGGPPPPVPVVESFLLRAAATEGATTDGVPAAFNLTIQNTGDATSVSWSVDGLPEGFTAAFDPATSELAAEAVATTKLTVEPPNPIPDGTFAFLAKAVGANGHNQTLELTVKASPTHQDPVVPSVTNTDDPEVTHMDETSVGDTAARGDSADEAAPGFDTMGVTLALLGALLVVRRRVPR